MHKEKYYPPIYLSESFHCPHCGVYTQQSLASIDGVSHAPGFGDDDEFDETNYEIHNKTTFIGHLGYERIVSKCYNCKKYIIRKDKTIIYPKTILVQNPNEDMDKDIQNDYMEAAKIFQDSPRASAALLRLALQKLCKQLGEKGDNINNDIGKLVEKGLDKRIQQSFDILRVLGNNASHPGEINLDEDSEKVLKMFDLINFIVEKMITEPKEAELFYDTVISEKTKNAIEKRDTSL